MNDDRARVDDAEREMKVRLVVSYRLMLIRIVFSQNSISFYIKGIDSYDVLYLAFGGRTQRKCKSLQRFAFVLYGS